MIRRLSDTLAVEFPRRLKEILCRVEECISAIEPFFEWKELPEPISCDACGVDGSRGVEKRSGAVVYAVSSVGIGNGILEMHEISIIEPFKHIEKRIDMHMETNEARIGVLADEELVILDGTLSNLLLIKPNIAELLSREEEFKAKYLDLMLEFVELLDEWLVDLDADVKNRKAQRPTLLSRTEVFDRLVKRYNVSKDDIADLRIYLEYVEFLHAYDRLLERDVVSVAKTVYKSRLSMNSKFKDLLKDYRITDQAVVDFLVMKTLGFERAGWYCFEYDDDSLRHPPLAEELNFKNVVNLKVYPCYVRLKDYENVYLLESNRKIDDKLMSRVLSLEADGYILPLIHAHAYAKIKKKELKSMIISLLNATVFDKPEYRVLLKHGRKPLDED